MHGRLILSRALAPASIIFGSVAGLASTVLAPHVLSSSHYIIFATAISLGQSLSLLLYEWLKQSILRFGSATSESSLIGEFSPPAINGCYRLISVGLLVLVVISLALSPFHSLFLVLAIASVHAASQGMFDGAQAWARARLNNIKFSILWIIRGSTLLVATSAVGFATGSGFACVAAAALGMSLCVFISDRKEFFSPLPNQLSQITSVTPYFKFGVFAALAASLTTAINPILRGTTGSILSADSAAGLILAADLSFKLFSIIGLGVNVVVSQNTFRKADSVTGMKRITLDKIQFIVPFCILLPSCILVTSMQPLVNGIAVPIGIAPFFESAFPAVAAGSLLLAIRLYCIDPIIIMSKRSLLSVLSPAISLSSFCGAIFAMNIAKGELSIRDVAACYLLSSIIGIFFSLGICRYLLSICLPVRQIGSVLIAGFLMATLLFIWPASEIPQYLAIPVSALSFISILAAIERRTIVSWTQELFEK